MQRVIDRSHDKGSGNRPGTPIRGQVIDRSLHKGSGDNPVTPAAAAAGDLSMMTVYTLYYYYYSITEMKIKNNFYTKLYCFFSFMYNVVTK